jgi:uncharacterized protein with HEPN domain
MQPKTRALLQDMLSAGRFVRQWTATATFEEYERNDLLRSAIERQFEIIGEAARRLGSSDPETASALTDVARIIGFRNVLAHGYSVINNAQVWDVIERFLPTLLAEVERLLELAARDNESAH